MEVIAGAPFSNHSFLSAWILGSSGLTKLYNKNIYLLKVLCSVPVDGEEVLVRLVVVDLGLPVAEPVEVNASVGKYSNS